MYQQFTTKQIDKAEFEKELHDNPHLYCIEKRKLENNEDISIINSISKKIYEKLINEGFDENYLCISDLEDMFSLYEGIDQ